MSEDDYYTHVPLNVIGSLKAVTPERLAQLLKAEADLAAARAVVRDICAEWNEDCDPACDSVAHSPTCKATNIANAKRALQADLAAAQKTLNDHLLSEAAETMRADKATSELAAARALLLEARASLSQIDDYRIDRMVARIDAALAVERKP